MVNQQTVKLFGYTKEELIGYHVELLIPDKFRRSHVNYISDYAENPKIKTMGLRPELIGKHKNGNEIPIEINLSPFYTDEGVAICAIIRDLYDRKYIQQLESKNKELEQFAYVASHDLQEPLRTILSFSALLSKRLDDLDSETLKILHYISSASTRMSNLIKGLLDYSRIGRDRELTLVNCQSLVHEIVEDFSKKIDETQAVIICDNLPVIMGYETELRILFQNLISNALKFILEDQKPYILINAEKKTNYWLFFVKDNGIGIEEEYLDRIFIIFQRLHAQNKYEGTGIGLAQCRKIVELHNGSIWIESEVGKGSTFYFTIPF